MSKKKQPIKQTSANAILLTHTAPKPLHTDSMFALPNTVLSYWKEALICFLLSFILYKSCISFGYVLDDLMVIQENKFTKEGFGGIWDILTTESFTGYFGEKKELVQGNRYRPLSIVTFAIEDQIMGGENPKVSHIINIFLYAITCFILFLVTLMLFRDYKHKFWFLSIPFMVTILFLVHPIHTEAVANIKGRDEIMSMLFALLALYTSLLYTNGSSRKWLILACVYYFLALLSKENAITFLAVIPITIHYFGRVATSITKTLTIWLVITTAAYLLLRVNTAGFPDFSTEIKDVMNNPFLGMSASEKWGSIFYTLWKYISLLVFPHPLSHDYYPYAIPKVGIFHLIPLLSVFVYGFLAYIAVKGWKNKSVLSYSSWFYLATISIVSNVVINLGTFMNERFVFMASAAYCFAVAYAIIQLLPDANKYGKYMAIALGSIMVIGYSAKTIDRVPAWKDAMSLNQAAVDVSTNSARANSFMATALFEEYKKTTNLDVKRELLVKVESYSKKSIAILPDYTYANLMLIGAISEKFKIDNDIDAYIKDMKPVILRRPDIKFIKEFSDYLQGLSFNDKLFPFYLEVGNTLLTYKDKRRDWALTYLMYAYNINSNNKQVNESIALAYELAGNNAEAERFKQAAKQNL